MPFQNGALYLRSNKIIVHRCTDCLRLHKGASVNRVHLEGGRFDERLYAMFIGSKCYIRDGLEKWQGLCSLCTIPLGEFQIDDRSAMVRLICPIIWF